MVDSKAAKELAIKLRKLWDNDNYVKGVIAFAKTEKNIITISQFIDMSYRLNKEITSDNISYLLDVLENKSYYGIIFLSTLVFL